MIELSIIIISYNTKDILKECLKSIYNKTNKDISFEVIIVDNASTDGTIAEVQSSKFKVQNDRSKLKIIENRKNVGFSKANNQGIKEANGRYLLFLNPDTIAYKDTLKRMVEFIDNNKDAGVATCKVVLPNGELDDACHRGFPTPWRAFCYFLGLSRIFPHSRIFAGYTMGWENLSKVHEIDSCSGAFMLVKSEAGEQIGWWDEDYFWYGEDLDFCYRLKEKGWKVYFVPSVSILHYKGVSGGIKDVSKHISTADTETKIRTTKARFEAMEIFYKKHYMKKYNSLITWLVLQAIRLKLYISLKSY